MSTFNNINFSGLKIIKQFEGFSTTPYLCPANKLTIGFGHVILPKEKFKQITMQQAEQILAQDLAFAIKAVNDVIGITLNHNQFSALVSFVYNLGRAAFATSALLRAINKEDHLNVPAELIRWKMAGGKPLKGLLLRRMAEATLYLS